MVITTSDAPQGRYLDETSDEVWRCTIASSLDSTYKIVRLVWPFFVKANKGKIVIGTSPMGIYGQPGQVAYASAVSLEPFRVPPLGLTGVMNRCSGRWASHEPWQWRC